MNQESKRIFLGNLPASTTEAEIRSKFSSYGNISTVEIKNKKDASDSVSYFAFVSLNIDYRNLQQCLQDFANNEWTRGHYINIQLAKESFLERLKREREEASANKPSTNDDSNKTSENAALTREIPKKNNILPSLKKNIQQDTSSSSSESDSEDVDDNNDNVDDNNATVVEEELTDFVIKSNKGKNLNGSHLKIESFGKAPIYTIEVKKPKSKDPKRSEADAKRIKSMLEMKKSYQQQKNVIKNALSRMDTRIPERRKLEDLPEDYPSKKLKTKDNKMSLFDEENEEAEEMYNFDVNEEFSGRKGRKLMELQSKFNHDKRFAMDSRFLDEEHQEENEEENGEVNEEEIGIDEEKRKQFQILEGVLGQPVLQNSATSKNDFKNSKSMLRFDPSAPNHSKYELEINQMENQKNKKTKQEKENAEEKLAEENAKSAVSQEQFYKVNTNLRESLQEKQSGFSLLNFFGRSHEEGSAEQSKETDFGVATKKTAGKMLHCDSSDEEANNEEETPEKDSKPMIQQASWNENFFFAEDDERFKEGMDFMKKLGGEGSSEFKKLRQDLKEIVRTKVRHNLRRNKPFKKKIGGKKMIKLKKAMKR